MTNSESNFVKIIKEICRDENIKLTPMSDEWVFLLEKDGRRSFIFGYQFGLNSAVSLSICNDKSTTYELLTHEGIPAVEHLCFMSPEELKYVGKDGCLIEIEEQLKKYGTIVVKDNQGTGGMEVFKVSDRNSLEHALVHLFTKCRSVATSPYINIGEEYRVILLDGEVCVMFSKKRPCLEGDGENSLRILAARALEKGLVGSTGELKLSGKNGERIPEKGEKVYLSWKHNLGQGAYGCVEDPANFPEVVELAKRAAAAVNGRFVSVDVIGTEEGTWKVLEINNGVMMENLAGESEELRCLVKDIYRRAIQKML